MTDPLEAQIALLPKMNRAELQRKWREALRQEPPAHLRKEMLVPLLAYKLQEQAYGGLSASARRRLHEIAARYESGPQNGKAAALDPFRAKPGTRLLRQWKGETHHVTVSETGFEYQGQQYRSLSVIARLITGTRWSGPAFFGLKPGQPRKST